MKPLKIAMVVHGRFHAFDLSRALLANGEQVRLLTNYPKRLVQRFGINENCVSSCVWHGLFARVSARIQTAASSFSCEPFVHRSFSRWAAGKVRGKAFDVIHCFSGVAEEVWQEARSTAALRSLVRGSSHIETQHQILEEEERLSGVPIQKPSDWIRAREKREYALSDQIMVLSRFAEQSFVAHGFEPSGLALVPLGSDLIRFRASEFLLNERKRRILSGAKLRVLIVGTWCRRKGVAYVLPVARELRKQCEFRFVGSIGKDAASLRLQAGELITFRPKVDQFELPSEYAWGDVFLFPTLEDGYAVVLAQAQAAGLPILATPNCAAPELVVDGLNGWICSIRSPQSYIELLRRAIHHRESLAKMADAAAAHSKPRDWSIVANDFSRAMRSRLSRSLTL